VCVDATECEDEEYACTKLGKYNDRKCCEAPPECQKDSKGVTALVVDGDKVETLCDGKTDLGGDGSAKAKAGKSCYTIKVGHGATKSAAYWIFSDDKDEPYSNWCDMELCGWDKGDDWTDDDKKQCGGWTLALKSPGSGNGCLNRHQQGKWRSKNTFGDTSHRDAQCAKGEAYHRASWTDVMIGSLRDNQWKYVDSFFFRNFLVILHPCLCTVVVFDISQNSHDFYSSRHPPPSLSLSHALSAKMWLGGSQVRLPKKACTQLSTGAPSCQVDGCWCLDTVSRAKTNTTNRIGTWIGEVASGAPMMATITTALATAAPFRLGRSGRTAAAAAATF
jgi:hypothetical protein